MLKHRRSAFHFTLVLVLSVTFASPTWPQMQETPASSNGQIRVVTNEVTVPVTATDKTGEFVLDLQQKDFRLFDDGAVQAIDHWELGGDPLAVALVVETSSRLHAVIPAIRNISSVFTETVMALDGEAAVITYDSNVEVAQPFTTDHNAVGKAIRRMSAETPEMSLYDGMSKAVELLRSQPTTLRRVMLVIGESEDDASKTNLGTVLRTAERADITIYAVGASSVAADLRGENQGANLKLPHLPRTKANPPPLDPMGRPYWDWGTPALWLLERGTNEISHHQLELAAAATGGIDYSAFHDSTLIKAIDRIGGELHAQYILTYRPNAPRSVGFHRIEVRVSRPDLTVRARPAYYFGPP
jgi:Ca-activated chloride channel homolog